MLITDEGVRRRIDRRYLVGGALIGIYLAWVLALHFVLIDKVEYDHRGIALPAIYGLPIAIEIVRPEAGDQIAFCEKLEGSEECKPVPYRMLLGHIESGRYEITNPSRKHSPATTPRPFFVIRNKLCNTSPNSFSVNCLSAYKVQGENGEEFYLCPLGGERCFIAELVGVQYPRG